MLSKQMKQEIVQIIPSDRKWCAVWLWKSAAPYYLVDPIACWALVKRTAPDNKFEHAVIPMLAHEFQELLTIDKTEADDMSFYRYMCEEDLTPRTRAELTQKSKEYWGECEGGIKTTEKK